MGLPEYLPSADNEDSIFAFAMRKDRAPISDQQQTKWDSGRQRRQALPISDGDLMHDALHGD